MKTQLADRRARRAAAGRPGGRGEVEVASHKKLTPMIFVHGGAGSGAQFESQALRFTSNGYPQRQIYVFEYDSTTAIANIGPAARAARQLIAQVKRQTGKSKVDVLGHSLGTTLMHVYLLDPARAANVAHYVNIDGRTGTAPPGGVPTLALWAGRGTPGREIVGRDQRDGPQPDPRPGGDLGRVVRADLQVLHRPRPEAQHRAPAPHHALGQGAAVPGERRAWATGRSRSGRSRARRASASARPRRALDIAADGSWGPVRGLKAGRHYEFALVLPGATTPPHLLRAVHAQRPPGAPAHVTAERAA